jgi:hypothetical protein
MFGGCGLEASGLEYGSCELGDGPSISLICG